MVEIACGCPHPGNGHSSTLEARGSEPYRFPAFLRPGPRRTTATAGLSPAKARTSASCYRIERGVSGPTHSEGGQTLGQMALGIRVVDAKTAAVPTPKQSAVRWATAMLPDAMARLVPPSERVEATLAAIKELQPEIDRLTRRHESDRERLNEELKGLFKEAKVNQIGASLAILLRALPSLAVTCVLYAPVLQGRSARRFMAGSPAPS